MSVDHQSVQEPVSHRLAKEYSPEGCWSSLFFCCFSFFFPFISAPFSGVCFNNNNMEHGMLFDKLLTRGLPVSIVRFLSSWYYVQQMCVRWNSSVSESFHVSNGVRQGGVLSPMLFAEYVGDAGSKWCWLLTLGAHARGLRYLLCVCVSVCLSVRLLPL